MAVSNGGCLHVALIPDRQLQGAAQLMIGSAAAAVVAPHNDSEGLRFKRAGMPSFGLRWAAADPSARPLGAQGPGGLPARRLICLSCVACCACWAPLHLFLTDCVPVAPPAGSITLRFPVGEHLHRLLPGCWVVDRQVLQGFTEVEPWWERATGSRKQRQQQQAARREILVVVELQQQQQPVAGAAAVAAAATATSGEEGSEEGWEEEENEPGAQQRQQQLAGGEQLLLPSVPASRFPAATSTESAAVLVPISKYEALLSREERLRWGVPPATPAWSSGFLQRSELPELASAVLNVFSSSCAQGILCPAPAAPWLGRACSRTARSPRQHSMSFLWMKR